MSGIDIERLQKLCSEASEGPWTFYDRGHASLGYDIDEVPSGSRGAFERREDAEFVAESRSAVPSLLEEVVILRQQLAEAASERESLWRVIETADEVWRVLDENGAEIDIRHVVAATDPDKPARAELCKLVSVDKLESVSC